MTIAATATSVQYLRNGATTQWGYPNKIFAAADLTVVDLDTSVPPVVTQLVLGTDYTVQNVDVDSGCMITTTVPGINGHTLDIRSNIAELQSTSIKNQGSFLPELHEEFFDKATRMIQDLKRLAYTFGLHGNDTEAVPWPSVGTPGQRANTNLGFGPTGALALSIALSSGTLSQASIGSFLYPRSNAEVTAGVVPVNFWYPYGNVKRFNAVGDGVTVDTVAIQNTIAQAAVGGNSSAQVFLPPGTYLTNATINRPTDVYIVGAGAEFTSITAAPTFNGNIIASAGTSSNIINRGGVQNLCINGSWGANHANTLSVGISDAFTNRAIHKDVRFHGCYIGMYGIGVWQVTWDNLQVDGAGSGQNSIGFYLDQLLLTLPSGTSNAVNGINCTAQGVADTGWRMLNPNGIKLIDCEAENGINGFYIGNTAAGCYPIQFGQFTGCVADTNSGIGFLVQQGSNASPVNYLQFANCWAGTHGNLGVYFDGCQGLNWTNGIIGNNSGAGLRLNNSTNCIIATTQFIANNQSNLAGLGDITISGGSFNKILGNVSNMQNATSVSFLESAGTNSNTVADNTFFQGATFIGAATRATNNQGYNPVGVAAGSPFTVGASPATITAGQSPETHYITQSATFNAAISKGGKLLGTLVSAFPMTVQLDSGGFYTVNWTTTAPTYVKDVH